MPDPQRPKADQEPLWREEFSIFTADERYVSRRQMTKFLTLTSFSMFVGNIWLLAKSVFSKEEAKYPAVTVAQAGEIPVGGVKLFQYADDNCILVHIDETSYAAFSQKCTHLSCAVYYAREHQRLECPCHEGFFNVRDGSVLAGPPTRPLPQVMLEQRGSELVAIGIKGSAA